MSDKPTGEWTADKLAGFYAAGELQEQQLCDAINAALAAERESVQWCPVHAPTK
jgi:hypothetical protein